LGGWTTADYLAVFVVATAQKVMLVSLRFEALARTGREVKVDHFAQKVQTVIFE
jgi:hypothetical protein